VAANEAVVHLASAVRKAHPNATDWEKVLEKGVIEANAHVYQLSNEREEYSGMGTTLSALLVTDHTLVCAHVGDSRIYRVRKGRLTQLTRDHSLKADLIASGELDESLALSFPHKNVITKALGTQQSVRPDITTETIEDGDFYFLCSDGLTDPLSEAQIHDIIDEARTPKEAVESLILAAKQANGGDNITVICIAIHW
jgi:protein phosphatase